MAVGNSANIKAVAKLPAAIAGKAVPFDARCVALLEARLRAFLTPTVLQDVLQILHPGFHAKESEIERCADFIAVVAEIFSQNRSLSVESMITRLVNLPVDQAVIIQRPFPKDASLAAVRITFAIIGWMTLLYKARWDHESQALAVNVEEAPTLLTSTLPPSFANRSTLEVLRNLGEAMPVPHGKGQYQGLKTASLHAATLKAVGKIQIRWVECISAHLDFDPISSQVKIFCLPSILALQVSPNSVLSRALEGYYDENRDPQRTFSLSGLSREIMLSYALLFRYDSGARKLYKNDARGKAQIRGCLDPMLDELCLGPRHQTHDYWHREPIKEHFDSISDFPILNERLMRIQDHIDSIQPTRMSSLWNDKRDILRWYTFWAVLILGGANLIIACCQTALTAAQVELARQALDLQMLQTAAVP